jgi:hypothetical protein
VSEVIVETVTQRVVEVRNQPGPQGPPGAADDGDVAAAVSAGPLTAAALSAMLVSPLEKTSSGAAAPITYRNVDDFGAVGDGVADDAPAFQAALDAAGVGGVVRVAPGKVYRLAASLITQTWQRLEGSVGPFGSGSSTPAELAFDVSGSTPGIRVRSYTHLKNLLIRGPGDAVGTCVGVQMFDSSANSVSMEDVSIDDWAVGAHLDQVYYGKFIRPEFRRNAVGLKITSSLNITLIAPQINSLRADGTTIGVGIQGAARPLTILGGSIEQCRTFISMTNSETLNLYGTYFETTLGTGLTDITCVQAGGIADATVNAHGCYVYMPFVFSWIDTRTSTDVLVTASGNTFIAGAATTAAASATAYRVTAGQVLDIGPDHWGKMENAAISYFAMTGGTLPYPRARLVMPAGHPTTPTLTYDGNIELLATELLTHSAAAARAVSLEYIRTQITMTANITSMSFTGTGQTRQRIELTFIQDATGGRTYTFPSQCRFAGGAAPSDTTANTRTTIGFQYDAFNNRWHETHRVVAVPNT